MHNVEQKLAVELTKVSRWLADNRLSLHLGKTQSIVFTNKRNLRNRNVLNIAYNGVDIKGAKSVNYLGLKLDHDLNGSLIAQKIISRANSRLKFMYRHKSCLSQKVRKILCTALISSHFDYYCCSWYSSLSLKYKKKLQICQNKIIRFISNLSTRIPHWFQ